MTQSFYHLPPSWDPGYVIPDYVMAEPPGMGAMVTKWLPRGTISELVPEFAPVQIGQKILARNDAGLGSLGDDTLGVQRRMSANPNAVDPITAYGRKGASWLIHSLQAVRADERPATLRAIFDAIDPSLWGRTESKANALRAQGVAAKPALEHGMAQALSEGFARELVDVGQRARKGERYPVGRKGQVALGVYPDAVPRATSYALEALGFSLSDIKKGASRAAGAVVKGVKTLGSLACKAANSKLGSPEAKATATATGPWGAAGAAGFTAAQKICNRNDKEAADAGGQMVPGGPMAMAPASRVPRWVKPVAIVAGVGLVGFLVVKAVR